MKTFQTLSRGDGVLQRRQILQRRQARAVRHHGFQLAPDHFPVGFQIGDPGEVIWSTSARWIPPATAAQPRFDGVAAAVAPFGDRFADALKARTKSHGERCYSL